MLEERVLVYDRIGQNRRDTLALMVMFVSLITALVAVISLALGLPPALTIAALVAVTIYAVFSYYFSASTVLSISGAREVTKEDLPDYYRAVENLCIGSGLPMPRLYVIADGAPNAFATGRDPKHASVAVTTGLLQ